MRSQPPRAPVPSARPARALLPPHSPEQRLDRGFLEKWRWSHLVMDEAHALKNRNASRTMRLRRRAQGAWAGSRGRGQGAGGRGPGAG